MANNVETVNFQFDSRLISSIGDQSVSDNVAALIEIVKNSYDADAKRVQITIAKDHIKVQDDGIGMTEKDLREKYLVIGTDNKTREIFSPKMKRRVLGSKGMVPVSSSSCIKS